MQIGEVGNEYFAQALINELFIDMPRDPLGVYSMLKKFAVLLGTIVDPEK
jgi:hypothetical protein